MCVLRKSPNSIIPAEDAAIRDFLKQLRIFDSQFNEEELEKEIIKIIESTYSVNNREAASIFWDVYGEVKTWWQSDKAYYITKENMFFENAKENFFKLSLVGLGDLNKAQTEALKLRFMTDHIKELATLIETKQILNIFAKNIKLTTAKVYQVLGNMSEYKTKESEQYDYKYMILNSVLNIENKVKDCFNKINLLVLVIENLDENLEKLYQDLFEKNKDKKIIIIRQINQKDNTKFIENVYEVEMKNLLELTEESQKELITKVSTTFQGEKVQFSSLLKDNKIKEFVDEVILSELVNTFRINIGESLNNLGEIENYYINRIFNCQVKIEPDLKYERKKFYVKYNSEITKESIEQNQDIVLISDIQDDFYKIRRDENCKSKNIHWLKEENGELTLQQSHGSLARLRNFIDLESISYKEEDMINIEKKVVIISAESGMGKSTVLTTLAQLLKKSDPYLWVQTINLNHHTILLDKMDLKKDGKEETIKLLLKIVKTKSDLEKELLKRRIGKEGKIVFLFDGFDEISPTYDKKVIKLLNVLKDTKVVKLWVTTRPHLRSELEDEFGVVAYTLKELTEDNQKTFLKKFWNKRLGRSKDLDNRSDSFICELLSLLKKSISDTELRITGVPLQTRMLAEVFQDEFEDFHASKKEVPTFPRMLNVVHLYQQFIDKKCKILYEEKEGVILTKPKIKRKYENEFYPRFLRNHKILGIDLIFYGAKKLLSMDEKRDLRKFKDDFNEEDDNTGIVIQILNDQPIFMHRTFAEYFAALWFTDEVGKNNEEIKYKLRKHIFKKRCEVIKLFFDRILATDEFKIQNIVLNNDESIDKLLLDDVNLFDKEGRTALHLAASYGYENILKILLENSKEEATIFKNPINTKDNVFDWTALMYSVKGHHANIAEYLLQNGAKSDDIFELNNGIDDYDKDKLMYLAAEKKYVKLFDVLIQNKNTNISYTPHIAAEYGNVEVMKELLKYYDIDLVDKYGNTPLYLATENEDIEVVKLLVDNGAKINNNNGSILYMASYKDNKEIVEFLINNGADTNTKHYNSKTSLYSAVVNDNIEVVKLLVDNINHSNAHGPLGYGSNWSILHFAALYSNKEIVEFLISKGADANAEDGNLMTPLYITAAHNKVEVLKLLVDNGANINAKNARNWSILHIAALFGNKEIVEFLINKGADNNAVNNDGKTPLYFAVKYEKVEVVKLLVDNGADIFAENDGGSLRYDRDWSILHMAAYNRNKEILEFLKDKGADINSENNNMVEPHCI